MIHLSFIFAWSGFRQYPTHQSYIFLVASIVFVKMRIRSVYRFFMNFLSSACDQDSEGRQENESMDIIEGAGEAVLEEEKGEFIQ